MYIGRQGIELNQLSSKDLIAASPIVMTGGAAIHNGITASSYRFASRLSSILIRDHFFGSLNIPMRCRIVSIR